MRSLQTPMVAASGGPLSTGAAARMAGVHLSTIHRAIERGELPALRLGPNGNYRIRREALEAWLRPANGGETP